MDSLFIKSTPLGKKVEAAFDLAENCTFPGYAFTGIRAAWEGSIFIEVGDAADSVLSIELLPWDCDRYCYPVAVFRDVSDPEFTLEYGTLFRHEGEGFIWKTRQFTRDVFADTFVGAIDWVFYYGS